MTYKGFELSRLSADEIAIFEKDKHIASVLGTLRHARQTVDDVLRERAVQSVRVGETRPEYAARIIAAFMRSQYVTQGDYQVQHIVNEGWRVVHNESGEYWAATELGPGFLFTPRV